MNPLRADHIGPLDMFKIGVGPSSSHTVGPMVAALDFRNAALGLNFGGQARVRLQVELYGSLSATGKGHSTDGAVCAGLIGLHPKAAEPGEIWAAMPDLQQNLIIDLNGVKVDFNPEKDIKWEAWFIDGQPLPHPNTIRF